jgi:hypothetical protein
MHWGRVALLVSLAAAGLPTRVALGERGAHADVRGVDGGGGEEPRAGLTLGRPAATASAASILLLPLAFDDPASCSPAKITTVAGGGRVQMAWKARGEADDDHVQVYVSRNGLSGVANCVRWTGPGCQALLPNGLPGRCALEGSIEQLMLAGFRVIHLLVMSAQGLPRGPHEHVMIHIPEHFPDEQGQMWDSDVCGTSGTEQVETITTTTTTTTTTTIVR